MTYSIEEIKKASEMAKIDKKNSSNIIASLEWSKWILDHEYLKCEDILDKVCLISEVSKKDLISKSRKQEFVLARAALSKILKDIYHEITFVQIGNMIDKQHSVVSDHYTKLVENDRLFRGYYFKIRTKIMEE